MSLPEVLAEQITTESLPLDLKLSVEKRVFALCNATQSEVLMEWVGKYNDQLHEIIQGDEEIKRLARAGKIEAAAVLAKQKLDEWFGHDVSL